jgi:hypothetical protein
MQPNGIQDIHPPDISEPPADWFPYETIKFSGRLEIMDRDGKVARFVRRQRVRFLQDGASVFFDRVWGDGVLFAGYAARHMRILDAIPTRKGYVVPLALPRPFARGQTFDIDTERRIVGAFIYPAAYWESAMSAPTDLLTLDVVAPPGLHFRRPEIIAPPRGDFDARQRARLLTFQVQRPALDIPYRLAWSWK